jgi:glycosyltransferase involved in cell wall biosynthesis
MKIYAYLEKGWEVHYIAVEPFPYTHPNLKPHILPTPFKNHTTLSFWIYFFSIAPWYIAWIAYQKKIQLISVFSLTYACLCAPAKWLTKVPLLTFIRTMKVKKEFAFSHSPLIFRVERLLEKAGMGLTDSLVVNSESIKIELDKLCRGKKDIQILYNHINELKFDKTELRKRVIQEFGFQENFFLIATSGLLIPRKNLQFLIEAFAKIDNDNAILLIIGSGPLLNSLQDFTKKVRLEDKIIFTGWREDILEILPGCDLFVFPSYLEGLSNSILEAMACDLPCLISDISENAEIITNPEQRFPLDHPDTLAEMINETLNSKEKLEFIRNFTIEDRKRFIFNWKEKIIEKAEELIKKH